ncbi:MAG: D-alanine--D-alanine ligase [Clostridia bacterium]|nr:D-alanine--D-alanine ligase [Clostridia bacterium]
MSKLKVGVIFGGMSTEHDVSIVSGTSVSKNLNKDKYEIYPIYINKEGKWFDNINIEKDYEVGDNIENAKEIENVTNYLKKLDVVFPVLHGLYGEDGTIQGMLELLKVPYVGCRVLGSSIAMDKVYTKIIFSKAKINQANYVYIRRNKDDYIFVDKNFNETKCSLDEVCELIQKEISYPMFIKPSNSGSSVGINKANNIQELKKYIQYASKYDNKILIEENIEGKEIECSVLGNEDVKASCLGEITPAENFYTFDAKYKNSESKLTIPANLNSELANKVREIAVKAFKAIDGKGFARVDFFVNEKDNKIYINEINTIPGFTKISMYPKLWEKVGLEYSNLLDELIKLAIQD